MRPKAYSYIRFSTTIQEHGDSLRRQTQKAMEYAEKHKLELDTKLNLHDLGVPAYKGTNFTKGALGQFIKLVDEGTIPSGSYLLIENFDRFSRLKPREAQPIFLNLINQGIKVVTLEDEKVYNEELDTFDLIVSLLSMERAHDESARKGRLVKASKDNAKRDVLNGSQKKLTKWGPKWLNLNEDRMGYTIIPERVELIKRIIQWVLDGYGTGKIIEIIESEGIPPMGSSSGIRMDKRKPKRWHISQIQRIVSNRQLLGEYELKIKNVRGEETVEIVPNYFPAIIDEDVFDRVQRVRNERDVNCDKEGKRRGGGGRKGKTYTNIFAKLAVCGYSIDNNAGKYRCESNNEYMVHANKDGKNGNTGKVYRSRYLQCGAVKENTGRCRECRKLWQYDNFEESFLTHVKDIDAAEIFGTNEGAMNELKAIKEKVESREGQLLHVKRQLEKIAKTFLEYETIPTFMVKQGNELEAKEIEIPKGIRKLKAEYKEKEEQVNNSSKSKSELIDLIGAMNGCTRDDELYDLRLRMSEMLKAMISQIEVYTRGRFFSEQWLEKILEKVPDELKAEVEDIQRKSFEQYKKSTPKAKLDKPFFIIRFKSGKSRLVMPHPKDPRSLVESMKWDDDGVIDYFRDTTTLKLFQRGVKSKDGDWRGGSSVDNVIDEEQINSLLKDK